jgi:WD40 repeat protein
VHSVAGDGTLKIYSLADSKQRRSTKISALSLSSCCLSPDGRNLVVGSWDDHVYLYSVVSGRVVSSVGAHDDAVSCLAIAGESVLSGSWDSTLHVKDAPRL